MVAYSRGSELALTDQLVSVTAVCAVCCTSLALGFTAVSSSAGGAISERRGSDGIGKADAVCGGQYVSVADVACTHLAEKPQPQKEEAEPTLEVTLLPVPRAHACSGLSM